MNTTQLQVFTTLAGTLSFTQTARYLCLTQPSVSYQLSSLEKELGAKLVERTRSSVLLTAAGRAALPVAREVLDRQAALAIIASQSSAKLEYTLGLPSLIIETSPELVSQTVGIFERLKLDGIVRISTLHEGSEVHDLLAGNIDVAMINLAKLGNDRRFKRALVQENPCIYAVVSKSDPLARKDRVRAVDLVGRALALPIASSDFYKTVETRAVESIPAAETLTFMHPETFGIAMAYVSAGTAVGFNGTPVKNPTLACAPLEGAFSFPIGLTWLVSSSVPAVDQIVHVIKTIWKQRPE